MNFTPTRPFFRLLFVSWLVLLTGQNLVNAAPSIGALDQTGTASPPPAKSAKPAETPTARSTWQQFRSEEGQFRILMPGTPTAKTIPVETDAGTLTQQQYMRASEYEVCAVTFMEVPPAVFEQKGVEQAIEDACDGAIREMKVRETQARRAVSIQGHPGRTIEAVLPDGSLEFLGRVYIVGTRMYIIFYGQRAGRDRADADRFFSSFAVE